MDEKKKEQKPARKKNQKQTRKSARRAYLNDFKKDEKGQYVYSGDLYIFNENERSRNQMLQKLFVLGGLLVLSVIVNGFLPVPGLQNSAFVLIPYIVELMTAISCCVSVVRIAMNGEALREYIYKATVQKLPGHSAVSAFGAGAAAIGEMIYLAQNPTAINSLYVLIFFLLQAVSFGSAFYLHRETKSQKWSKK